MEDNVSFLVNHRIEILMDDGIYLSNIQDIDEGQVGISIPVKDGVYLPLRRGDRVEGLYYNSKGIFKFNTVVTGRKIDRIMMILLAHPKKFTKVQRRNFVRVPLVTNVYCAIIDKQINLNNIGDNQVDFFDAFSLDISAGGMKLSTDKEVNKGDILMATMPIKDEVITIKGKVIRVENIQNKNICGICFLDVDDKTVEKIMKALFQIMREQRKNAPRED